VDPDIRLTLGKMEPLSKVFSARNQALAAEEGDFVGGGQSQRKSAQVCGRKMGLVLVCYIK